MKFINEIKRSICDRGRIVIVEWQKIKSEFGPPVEHRLDKIDLLNILDTFEFSDIRATDIGENYYGVIAIK